MTEIRPWIRAAVWAPVAIVAIIAFGIGRRLADWREDYAYWRAVRAQKEHNV